MAWEWIPGKGRYFGSQHRSISGQLYHWRYSAGKKSSGARGWLSIPMENADYALSLEHEHFGRKIAKLLAFTTEFQTGDAGFDNLIFINCDDVNVCNRLASDAELRRLVLVLFEHGISQLSIRSGKLTAYIKGTYPTFAAGINEGDDAIMAKSLLVPIAIKLIKPLMDDTEADSLVKVLYTIKGKLEQAVLMGAGTPSRSKSNQQRARYFCSAMWLSFVVGVVLLIYDRTTMYTLTSSDIYSDIVMPYASGVLVAIVASIYVLFHHTSYGYDALKHFLFAGVLGTVLCVSEAAYNINVLMDNSEADVRRLEVLDKFTTKGSKGKVYYHVLVRDWHNPAGTYDLKVTQALHNNAVRGGNMTIYTHRGHLGYEWIEKYEMAE